MEEKRPAWREKLRGSCPGIRGTAPVQWWQHFIALTLHQFPFGRDEGEGGSGVAGFQDSGTVGWMLVPSTSRLLRNRSGSQKEENEFRFHPVMLWNLKKSWRNWRNMNWLIVCEQELQLVEQMNPLCLLMNRDASPGRSPGFHWRALTLAYLFQELECRHRRQTHQIGVGCKFWRNNYDNTWQNKKVRRLKQVSQN